MSSHIDDAYCKLIAFINLLDIFYTLAVVKCDF